MHPFITFIRRSFYKAVLSVGNLFYKITFGMFPEGMFYSSVKTTKGYPGTDVKIVSEDEESVTFAKFDKNGIIKGGYFKILATSDLHVEDDPKLRRKTFQMLANQICTEKPDLVIFTGDVIQSKFQPLDTIQFARFMERLGVYWAIVFGNHEAREEKEYFKWLLLDNVASYPHCIARHGSPELFGYGNYHINILNGEDSLQQVLFMFDSGRDIIDKYREEHGVPADMRGYDFLKKNQIEWYKHKVDELTETYGKFKSLMFFHIPLKEYELAIETEPDENGCFNFRNDTGIEVLYGSAYEGIGSSPFNSGMFDAILEKDSTKGVFCGHDHVNDFCIKYKGVCLTYLQTGGYETYCLDEKNGSPEEKWPQGATIIRISDNGDFALKQSFNREFLKTVRAQKAQQKKTK